jgi:hypothetical protein
VFRGWIGVEVEGSWIRVKSGEKGGRGGGCVEEDAEGS